MKNYLLLFSFLFFISCGDDPVNPENENKEDEKDPDEIEYIELKPESTPMIHPGGLHTEEDISRVKEKVASGKSPWIAGWNKLIENSHAQATYTPNPTIKIIRGGSTIWEPESDNYSRAMNDAAAAYQLGLRWKISGEIEYAEAAVHILNAWATTCVSINGDSNMSLAAGIYGYQFAVAGELLREYDGWSPQEFTAYQQWMVDVFYPANMDFLVRHHDTNPLHYWANWDLCNLASMIGIGILADRRDIYNYAINYFQYGTGNGRITHAINHVFSGQNENFAQLQESGRDQGHATLVIALMGVICQLTWNQGDDFYGFNDNMFLKACEHTAKYNVAMLDVPFEPYEYLANNQKYTATEMSTDGRGMVRPMWSAPFYHYSKIKGITNSKTTYTEMGVKTTAPEGGGGDYGGNSGGFDQLGFGTLMYTR